MSSMASGESFVFALRPTHEEMIQGAKGCAKGGRVETPVVANPTPKHRLNPLGDLLQGEIVATGQPPPPDALPHRFGGFVAHGGGETHKELTVAVLRRPRAKRIPQEAESALGITASPVSILAADDSRLLPVELKATLREAGVKRPVEQTRLGRTHAVADDIVGVALEGDVRVMFGHPAIERIVQEEICQERTDHRPPAGSLDCV